MKTNSIARREPVCSLIEEPGTYLYFRSGRQNDGEFIVRVQKVADTDEFGASKFRNVRHMHMS